jgi:hypothetical protein
MAETIQVFIEDEDNSTRIDPETGALEIAQPGGGVVVNFDDHRKKEEEGKDWFANLADDIDAMELSRIANDLLDAIEADDRSRQGYLEIVARGIGLLGLKLEQPKSTVGDSSATSEGMSSITNPLLLEAILKGWANARAELLPAEGPVKIEEAPGDESPQQDDLAEALERDMNYYFTVKASEYVPDTSHMLLWGTYFKGSGFKKVYRCPMRRRPVSESVDAKDLIVSDTTKDLKSCGRITHQIEMRPSVMKRMKLLKAYRNADLTQPSPSTNPVEQKIAGIQGTQTQKDRPEDEPYNLYETQCELDLPQYAPGEFKDARIPLPYLVTIDKDSREILQIRRDWAEDDEECERQRMYVKYPYIPGPGFYGTGMLNILGNSSAAMTAVDREGLDAGMFASFPGGVISKIAGRQNTSNFRVAPGEFAPVETGNMKISDVMMPMPYKDVTPGLMAMRDKILEQSKSLAGAAEIPAGEGLQNIPVGTMLAQIEQATKVMSAAHKDMHDAQAEEIELTVELFRRNPDDFFRGVKKRKQYDQRRRARLIAEGRLPPNARLAPVVDWTEEKFLQALDDYQLVPRSDPNTPSHLHRVMKAVAYTQIMNTPLAPYFKAKQIAEMICRALKDNPASLVTDPPPQQANVDPAAMAKLQDSQTKQLTAQTQAQKVQMDASTQVSKDDLKRDELQSKERVAGVDLQKEMVIHQNDHLLQRQQAGLDTALQVRKQVLEERKHSLDAAVAAHDMRMDQHQAAQGAQQAQHDQQMDVAGHAIETHQVMHPPKPAATKGGSKK